MIRTALVRRDRIFRRRNMKAHVVKGIHDSLWVEAPEAKVDTVRTVMRTVMTAAGELDVPLEIDFD